jgi:hypothetical protein
MQGGGAIAPLQAGHIGALDLIRKDVKQVSISVAFLEYSKLFARCSANLLR